MESMEAWPTSRAEMLRSKGQRRHTQSEKTDFELRHVNRFPLENPLGMTFISSSHQFSPQQWFTA